MMEIDNSILVTVAILLLPLAGCSSPSAGNSDPTKPTDTNKVKVELVDGNHWILSNPGTLRSSASVRAFKGSPKTQQYFGDRKEYRETYLERLEFQAHEGPTEAIRDSARKEIESFRQGNEFLGSWDGWPVIMLVPIYDDEGKSDTDLLICQNKSGTTDLLYIFERSGSVDKDDLLKTAKQSIQLIKVNRELLHDKGAVIFDVNGDLNYELQKRFPISSGFLEQQ